LDLARTYAALRGSPIFLLVLAAFVTLWLLAHHFLKFDPDFGMLNMCLSIEASVSLAFFTMLGERASQSQNKQAESLASVVNDIKLMSASLIEVANAQKSVLETHTQVLETLRKNDQAILDLASAEERDGK
jgi:uncharacterized membrane protein